MRKGSGNIQPVLKRARLSGVGLKVYPQASGVKWVELPAKEQGNGIFSWMEATSQTKNTLGNI